MLNDVLRRMIVLCLYHIVYCIVCSFFTAQCGVLLQPHCPAWADTVIADLLSTCCQLVLFTQDK